MDSYKQFLNSLPPVLNLEEQDELLLKYFQTRDADTREKLLVHNLRLCAQCASNFCKKYNLQKYQEDFFSVCYDQLAGALDRFDPTGIDQSKDASFATFALKSMTLSLMRYVQHEDYFSSHLVDTIAMADNKNNEDSDMFSFLFDDTHLQEEVQTKLFKEEIIKFIDGIKGPAHKKTMIKMYLGLDFPKRYSRSEIASIFKCSRETASTTVAKYLNLLQRYVSDNYGSVFPEYARVAEKNCLTFKNNSERNKYILDSYYNDKNSKSIGVLAKELGISKSCISEIVKRYQDDNKGNSLGHQIVPKKSRYSSQLEEIFNDKYGVNGSKPLSKQEIIIKYNIPSSSYSYSHFINSVESALIKEGIYTAEEVKEIKKAFGEKSKQARMEKCKEVYYSYLGECGYNKKSLVQLAVENRVAVSTITGWINRYKKHLASVTEKNNDSAENNN